MQINGLQILFQMINFGVVFGAIVFLLYKPIIKMLDDRRLKIEEGERAAEMALREKEEIDVLKKRAKTQQEKEAAKVLEKVEEEAKVLKATLTKQAKEEVKTLKEKEMAKWEAEKKGMKAEMQKQVNDLAVAIASKVIGAEVDKKTHASLITSSLKDLEKIKLA